MSDKRKLLYGALPDKRGEVVLERILDETASGVLSVESNLVWEKKVRTTGSGARNGREALERIAFARLAKGPSNSPAIHYRGELVPDWIVEQALLLVACYDAIEVETSKFRAAQIADQRSRINYQLTRKLESVFTEMPDTVEQVPAYVEQLLDYSQLVDTPPDNKGSGGTGSDDTDGDDSSDVSGAGDTSDEANSNGDGSSSGEQGEEEEKGSALSALPKEDTQSKGKSAGSGSGNNRGLGGRGSSRDDSTESPKIKTGPVGNLKRFISQSEPDDEKPTGTFQKKVETKSVTLPDGRKGMHSSAPIPGVKTIRSEFFSEEDSDLMGGLSAIAHGGWSPEPNAPVIWGVPKVIDDFKFDVDVRELKNYRSRYRSTESGDYFRYPSRLYTTGKPFARKRKEQQASVLVDCSASMGIDPEEIEALLEIVPATLMAGYASEQVTARHGGARIRVGSSFLWIIANAGSYSREAVRFYKDKELGENLCDMPALEWLAQQATPRIWISDGRAVPMAGPYGEAVRECLIFCKQNKINFVRTPEEAQKVFMGKRLLNR